MKTNCTMKALLLALFLAGVAAPPMAFSAPPAKATLAQQRYASPEEAVAALVEALRRDDRIALLTVLGGASDDWLASGDEVADRADRNKFVAAYEQKHELTNAAEGTAVLLVGDDNWPFPVPLVRKPGGWAFDTAAGKEELINRRIGRNELDTIQTLLAVVDAEREYAAADPDRDGYNDYAKRFMSSPGRRDGLYWPVGADEPPSPLGPLVASAAREGYGKKSATSGKAAYHGYRYRLLTGQGKHAPGGRYDYMHAGRLLGGFAVIAYPAKYGVSGVTTFMVSHEGAVYEKNLGPGTEKAVAGMSRFDPDATWRKVK